MSDSDKTTSGGDPGLRPMTIPMAVMWTVVTTFGFLVLLSVVLSLGAEAKEDIVSGIGCQFIAYTLGLFFILRIHAPEMPIRRFLGVRRTSVGFYPLAVVLGASLQLPFNALYSLLLDRFPSGSPSRLEEVFHAAPLGERVLISIGLIAIGPLVEEIFFRGAIFVPLRTKAGNRPVLTVLVTSALFAVVHIEWQQFLWIFVMGLLLGILRKESGSLIPTVLAHASFNAIATLMLVFRLSDPPGGTALLVGSGLVAAATVYLIFWLGLNSEPAKLARSEEAMSP